MSETSGRPATTLPWERQEGETARAFAAFVIYRDLGSARSLAKVGQNLGKTKALCEQWSREWSWVARVQAWDDDQHRQAQQDRAAARRRALDRQASVAEAVIAQAARHLTPPKHKADGMTEMTREERAAWVAPNDALRAATMGLKEAATIQRLIYGLPTVITKTQAETEEAVRDALEAQKIIERIMAEYLDNECLCEACHRTRDRLRQLHQHQERAAAALLPTFD